MALFEIRATLEQNNNQAITATPFTRVVEVPGSNAVNSVPFYAAHMVLHHCRTMTTNVRPKNGGQSLRPVKVEIYIFSPSTVTRHGFTQGNTGPEPIWTWNPAQTKMTLRAWGEPFRNNAVETDQGINTLPLLDNAEEV